jgi:hypothetical protein
MASGGEVTRLKPVTFQGEPYFIGNLTQAQRKKLSRRTIPIMPDVYTYERSDDPRDIDWVLFYLGTLCCRGHNHYQGYSLRYFSSGGCYQCIRVRRHKIKSDRQGFNG